MWIKDTSAGHTVEFKLEWMDAPVQLNDNQTAQVPDDVGERLVEEVDAIERYDGGDN